MIDQSLKEVPQLDKEAINRRKKGLAKAITDEGKGLLNFGIAKKI